MTTTDTPKKTADEYLAEAEAQKVYLIKLEGASLAEAMAAVAALPAMIKGKRRRRIEQLVRGIFRQDSSSSFEGPDADDGKYHFKTLELHHSRTDALLFLLTTVGRVNDEGTWAAIMCRQRRHVCLTRRGGVSLLNRARYVKNKDGSLRKVRAAEGRGLWSAIHEITE